MCGRRRVSACSREEDKTTCCFCTCVNDVPPRPFKHDDLYLQVEVQPLPRTRRFTAGAVVAGGIPPEYLRRKGWKVSTESSKYDLADDANGVDVPLRRRTPDLGGGGGSTSPSPVVVVVGRWYVPFIFVRVDDDERRRVRKDLVRRCMFYRMTLEQSWKQIYSCTRETPAPAQVMVTATVRRSEPRLGGTYPAQEEEVGADGVKWFRPAATTAAAAAVGRRALGLNVVVWERMRWELERGGWVAGDEEERIERVERCDVEGLQGQWDKFECYMLVETFVLTRMDGSVALSYQFSHTDKIRTTWE